MTLNSPLNTLQQPLGSTTICEYLSQPSLNQDSTGAKSISQYLGEPKERGYTQDRGRFAELIAFNTLSRLGYDVRFEAPCDYDLTIHGESGITRLQVKSISDRDRITLGKSSMRASGPKKSRYKIDAFDFLCTVNLETEEVYLIPIKDLESSSYRGELKATITMHKYRGYKII